MFSKIFLGLFCLGISTLSSATQLTVLNPCNKEPWLAITAETLPGKSVGAWTREFLEQSKFPYKGSDAGLSTIGGLPAADRVLEVLAADQMRAYGWCYQVDGVEPGLMPDQYLLSGRETSVLWFLGFAEYSRGEWVSMCKPTDLSHATFLCDFR
jgi:hypothetical protein